MRLTAPVAALLLVAPCPPSAAAAPLTGPFTEAPIVAEWADPATPPDAAFERVLGDASTRAADRGASLAGLVAPILEVRRRTDETVPIAIPEGRHLRPTGQDGVSAETRAVFETIRATLASDAPVGILPELKRPDLLCKPAGLAFDRARVRAIAEAVKARSVDWAEEALPFQVVGSSAEPLRPTPGTLIFSVPWPYVPGSELRPPRRLLSNGVEGQPRKDLGGVLVHDPRPPLKSIAGSHTCFGRVDGDWKIVLVVSARP